MTPIPWAFRGTTTLLGGTSRIIHSFRGLRASLCLPSFVALSIYFLIEIICLFVFFSRWFATTLRFFPIEGRAPQIGVLMAGILLTLLAIALTLLADRHLKKTLKVD